MIETLSVRRRARSLLLFLDSFSEEYDGKNQNSEELDFNKANFNLARIPDIPQEMKSEIADNPNSLWNLIEPLKSILNEILQRRNNPDQDGSYPKHIIQDAVLDQLDDSIPEDYKNKLPDNLQKRMNSLLKGIGEDNLNYIKSDCELLDKLQKKAVDQLCQNTTASFDEDVGKKLGREAKKQKQKEEILYDFGYAVNPSGLDTKFEDTNYQILEEFAEKLSKSEDLQHLAEVLGRHENSEEDDDNAKAVPVPDRFELSRAYRGNVVGFEYSNDISRIVPSEMSLLKNPATESLFYHKFAEKQLLSYSYEQKSKANDKGKRQNKGPIVLCIDTSGSMMGKPEDIAKSIVFAVSRIAIKEKRNCYIISFSVGTESLDFADFGNGQALNKLIGFLKNSFYGGTDVEPCLKQAMDQLKRNVYQKADVMVISDFQMYDLGKKTIENMNMEKSLGTRFHSMLVAGYGANQSVLNQFDNKWKYEGSDNAAGIRFSMEKSTEKEEKRK